MKASDLIHEVASVGDLGGGNLNYPLVSSAMKETKHAMSLMEKMEKYMNDSDMDEVDLRKDRDEVIESMEKAKKSLKEMR